MTPREANQKISKFIAVVGRPNAITRAHGSKQIKEKRGGEFPITSLMGNPELATAEAGTRARQGGGRPDRQSLASAPKAEATDHGASEGIVAARAAGSTPQGAPRACRVARGIGSGTSSSRQTAAKAARRRGDPFAAHHPSK